MQQNRRLELRVDAAFALDRAFARFARVARVVERCETTEQFDARTRRGRIAASLCENGTAAVERDHDLRIGIAREHVPS